MVTGSGVCAFRITHTNKHTCTHNFDDIHLHLVGADLLIFWEPPKNGAVDGGSCGRMNFSVSTCRPQIVHSSFKFNGPQLVQERPVVDFQLGHGRKTRKMYYFRALQGRFK